MKFKTFKIEDGFKNPHPILSQVVTWAEQLILKRYGKEPVMTESSRTEAENIVIYSKEKNPKTGEYYLPKDVPGSVHMADPLRGGDFRTSMFTHQECLAIQQSVNDAWVYDPTRPEKLVCLYHKLDSGAYHFHIQVHPNTVMRDPKGAEMADGYLTPDFKRSEFMCKDGCKETIIRMELVNMLQAMREKRGRRIDIEEGFCCSSRIREIKPGRLSSLARGYAVRIKSVSSRTNYELITLGLEAGFKRFGIGDGYVEVDINPNRPVNSIEYLV
jgi:hypothetical protein